MSAGAGSPQQAAEGDPLNEIFEEEHLLSERGSADHGSFTMNHAVTKGIGVSRFQILGREVEAPEITQRVQRICVRYWYVTQDSCALMNRRVCTPYIIVESQR